MRKNSRPTTFASTACATHAGINPAKYHDMNIYSGIPAGHCSKSFAAVTAEV